MADEHFKTSESCIY